MGWKLDSDGVPVFPPYRWGDRRPVGALPRDPLLLARADNNVLVLTGGEDIKSFVWPFWDLALALNFPGREASCAQACSLRIPRLTVPHLRLTNTV